GPAFAPQGDDGPWVYPAASRFITQFFAIGAITDTITWRSCPLEVKVVPGLEVVALGQQEAWLLTKVVFWGILIFVILKLLLASFQIKIELRPLDLKINSLGYSHRVTVMDSSAMALLRPLLRPELDFHDARKGGDRDPSLTLGE